MTDVFEEVMTRPTKVGLKANGGRQPPGFPSGKKHQGPDGSRSPTSGASSLVSKGHDLVWFIGRPGRSDNLDRGSRLDKPRNAVGLG